MRKATPLIFGLVLASPVAGGSEELFRPPPRAADAVRVLLVTGGHGHDISFYSVLDGYDDLAVRVDSHPDALAGGSLNGTETVVLYDMPGAMTPEQRQGLRAFVEAGGGVVALHHAIAGRNDWRWWWHDVVGGRYLREPDADQPASTYKHDEELEVTAVAKHPVTEGVTSFRILDETYKGIWISPEVTPLLATDNPTSDGPVAWIGPHPKARVVFIQLGHGREAHLHPAFRRLVRNAVLWTAGR
jgi:type 1 glutamine amidotransferase